MNCRRAEHHPEGRLVRHALKGTVNFQPNPSWLQVVAWIAYVVPVLSLYLRKPSVTTPRDEQVRAV